MKSTDYVYCTHCKNFRIDDEDKPYCPYEDECDIWDCEDSRRYAERPKYKPITNKRFILLKNTAYNDEGDILDIIEETDNEIYYYDSFKRWCYLNKSEEHNTFEYKITKENK
ncbi:protein of unknown function [Ruminococcaceae bacterium BL-6]|nr:protein of unknown function [Ruminococcaceae bacterium BL-6]